MSVVPPGAAGTTILTPWVGFQGAWAPRLRGREATAGSGGAPAKGGGARERRRIIVSSIVR